MNLVFIDASAWIALYHKRDKYQQVAWKTYEQILHEPGAFWTSNWVAYEAISILSRVLCCLNQISYNVSGG